MKGLYLISILCIIYSSNINAQDCTGKVLGEFLPHPTDCNKYYRCINEKAILHKCPVTLEWNVFATTCDYPERAKCKVSFINYSDDGDFEFGKLEKKICAISENGFYRYPGDCTKGILCNESKWLHTYSCEAPFLMNVDTMGCEPAENINCDIYQ